VSEQEIKEIVWQVVSNSATLGPGWAQAAKRSHSLDGRAF
jgi:hypothetical protein